MKTKLITKAEFDRLDGPGSTRLRASLKAKAIREATIADQAAGRKAARRNKAAQDALQTPADAPPPAPAGRGASAKPACGPSCRPSEASRRADRHPDRHRPEDEGHERQDGRRSSWPPPEASCPSRRI
jgi:hypothetical protein